MHFRNLPFFHASHSVLFSLPVRAMRRRLSVLEGDSHSPSVLNTTKKTSTLVDKNFFKPIFFKRFLDIVFHWRLFRFYLDDIC